MSSQRYRRKKKKRFGGILLKFILLFCMISAMAVGATIFFTVETLTVEGNQRYSTQEIVAATQVTLGENLFTVNRSAIQERVTQQLPYIKSFTVALALPTGLHFIVEEEQSMARISTFDGIWIMGLDGKLLEHRAYTTDATPTTPTVPSEGVQSLPLPEPLFTISGLGLVDPQAGSPLQLGENESYRKKSLLALMEALRAQDLLTQVLSIDMSKTAHITFTYQDRFRVNFPFDGDYDYKLRAFLAAADNTEGYETGVMDLTSDSYAVLFTPD